MLKVPSFKTFTECDGVVKQLDGAIKEVYQTLYNEPLTDPIITAEYKGEYAPFVVMKRPEGNKPFPVYILANDDGEAKSAAFDFKDENYTGYRVEFPTVAKCLYADDNGDIKEITLNFYDDEDENFPCWIDNENGTTTPIYEGTTLYNLMDASYQLIENRADQQFIFSKLKALIKEYFKGHYNLDIEAVEWSTKLKGYSVEHHEPPAARIATKKKTDPLCVIVNPVFAFCRFKNMFGYESEVNGIPYSTGRIAIDLKAGELWFYDDITANTERYSCEPIAKAFENLPVKNDDISYYDYTLALDKFLYSLSDSILSYFANNTVDGEYLDIDGLNFVGYPVRVYDKDELDELAS